MSLQNQLNEQIEHQCELAIAVYDAHQKLKEQNNQYKSSK